MCNEVRLAFSSSIFNQYSWKDIKFLMAKYTNKFLLIITCTGIRMIYFAILNEKYIYESKFFSIYTKLFLAKQLVVFITCIALIRFTLWVSSFTYQVYWSFVYGKLWSTVHVVFIEVYLFILNCYFRELFTLQFLVLCLTCVYFTK